MELYEIITMYSPILVTVLSSLSTFCVLLNKLKSFSFKKDTEELTLKVKTVVSQNEELIAENRKLRKQLSIIIDKNMKIADYEDTVNEIHKEM